ncbi:MAG: hypothetical protein GEU93_04430 [Propionibacteriales bacterium]|nr:hypothetical protein [Propionibacteriales bacterium]
MRRTKARATRAGIAVVAAVVVASLLLAAQPGGTAAFAAPVDDEAELDVLHLNIWGHVGNADSEEEVRALVDNLVDLVHERQPDLVSLNEVCKIPG